MKCPTCGGCLSAIVELTWTLFPLRLVYKCEECGHKIVKRETYAGSRYK